MKNTDFVDEDLLRERGWKKKLRTSRKDPMPAPEDDSEQAEVPVQSISELNLGRLAKHRQEVGNNMVRTITDLEELRKRQQELEEEKQSLEDLGRKQHDYTNGKREMVERLNEGIIALEKKVVQSAQLTELLIATRNRFKEALEEIESIDEERWPDDHFREELYKALVIIDDARMEHNKALAKIQILEGSGESVLGSGRIGLADSVSSAGPERSFGYWIKVGFALSLPLIVLALIISGVYVTLLLVKWI